MARRHRCAACEGLKPGGTSSGQVPPAITHAQYGAWEAVAMDTSEWIPPNQKTKIKFLVMMDVATKLRAIQPLFSYGFLETRAESGADVIKAFSERWLGTFPKPRVVLLDSGKSFVSEGVQDFFSNLNIMTHYVAGKESWAHGTVEAAIQDVKRTASTIYLDDRELPLSVVLHLATSALNSTEYTAGYSAFPWAYVAEYNVTDEDVRTFQRLEP